MGDLTPSGDGGQFLLYSGADGESRIECRLQGETLWLTQSQIAELFATSSQNISQHLSTIYMSGELCRKATVKKYFTVRQEGRRQALQKAQAEYDVYRKNQLSEPTPVERHFIEAVQQVKRLRKDDQR